ncbi:MAG: hypothetical protein IJU93_07010 [Lachnospiraceae bacterium]|nr:hypothetical protein [Lachnospiraceae bacterium]
MTEKKITRKDYIVSAAFMCFGLALTLVYIYLKREDLMEASVSGDFLLGNYLNVNGGIYTTGWYYGRSPLIVNIQFLYKLLFRFLPIGFKLIRMVSAVLFALMIAGSYIFMMSSCGMKREGLLSAGIFMLPFGHWYAKFCLFGGERAIYVFAAFVSMGLLFTGIRASMEQNGKIRMVAALLLGCGGALLTSLDSSLMFRVFYLPLLLASVIMAVMTRKRGFGLLMPAAMLVVSYAANLISDIRIKPWFICEEPVKNVFGYLFKEGFFDKLYDSFNFFGWIRGASIMSLTGVLNALAPVVAALVIFSIARLAGRFRRLAFEEQLLLIFSLCAYFTAALLFSSTSDYDYQDWIVVMVFFAAVCAVEFRTEDLGFFTSMRSFALPAVYLCFILLGISEFLSPKTDRYGFTVKLEAAAEYLVSNGYNSGFAPYDQANILSECGNGALDTYGVSGAENLGRMWENWSVRQRDQAVEHMSEQPEGRIFVLLPHDNNFKENGNILTGCEDSRVYEDAYCEIYGFESMEDYRNSVERVQGE